MYIITNPAVLKLSFILDNDPIPEEWIQLGRGAAGMHQRLGFGPPDDDPHFLDDIKVVVGASERTLTGGYDVAKRVEVGPLLVISESRDLEPVEIILRPPVADPTPCSQSRECPGVLALKVEFENSEA